MSTHIDVLIVGAGPVGLFCANELTRHGLNCRIIEKKATLSTQSKALGLHIRTLSIFDDVDMFDDILKEGQQINRVIIKSPTRALASIDFKHIHAQPSFMISLPQDQTEAILHNHLLKKGVDVEWLTQLEDIKQTSDEVITTCVTADGLTEQIHSKWLIACDGAHSRVREICNIVFKGESYEQHWWLADLNMLWKEPDDQLTMFVSDDGPLACFPMGNKRHRMVMTAPDNTQNPTLDDIKIEFLKRTNTNATMYDATWMTRFSIHHRQIEHYQYEKFFFAGDAAHIHSPMGGQGLNTGIQDAYNLAWKLALVTKHLAPESLLATYHTERFPVGLQVLKDTDNMTRMILIKNPLLIKLRNQLMSFMMRISIVRKRFALRLSELDIRYSSSIIASNGSIDLFKPGTFVKPYTLSNSATGITHSIREITKGGKHHLFIVLTKQITSINSIQDKITEWQRAYGCVMDIHFVTSADTNPLENTHYVWISKAQAFNKLKKPLLVLIRPDKYIAYTQYPLDTKQLERYLKKLFL